MCPETMKGYSSEIRDVIQDLMKTFGFITLGVKNVLLIKAIISTCFDTMDDFMHLAIVLEQ